MTYCHARGIQILNQPMLDPAKLGRFAVEPSGAGRIASVLPVEAIFQTQEIIVLLANQMTAGRKFRHPGQHFRALDSPFHVITSKSECSGRTLYKPICL